MHYHNRAEIILIESGSSQYDIEGKKYAASAGTLVVISRLERHEIRIHERPYVRRFLLIDPDFYQRAVQDPVLASLFRNRPPDYRHAVKLDGPEYLRIRDRLERIHAEARGDCPFRSEALSAMLELLAVELFRIHPELFAAPQARRGSERILEAQSLIEARYLEPDLDVPTLATAVFCSPDYLSHSFRRATGYSVMQYVQLLRIAHAKDLLVRTDLPVCGVCRESGFGDASHFIRAFRGSTGTTPLQFRKRLRES
jgi:AraC-like DNA-binding protein